MSAAIPETPTHNPNCFGCGTTNPQALGFRVTHEEPGLVRGTITFQRHQEGGVGRVHGGVLASALDEVLGQLAAATFGGDCMTAQLNIRFRAPGATGDTCEAEGRIVRRDGRKLWVTGVVRRGDVDLCTAEGLWIEARKG